MSLRIFISTLGLLFCSLLAFAQSERITNFDVQLKIESDRSIMVTENISVFANGNIIKRGITRNFPTHRDLNGRRVKMQYDIVEIQKDGKTEPYFTESTDRGYMIYIGQREVFLQPGNYTYTIQYKVPNQIGIYEDYDEIYWNAVGTDVVFEVEKASCKILLPYGATVKQQAAYVGYRGQSEKDYTVEVDKELLQYVTTRKLNPREGFTVAIGFEKGFVKSPTLFESYGTMIVIILGLIFLLPYYIYTWWKYGQDPPSPASYPIYESPNGLSAAGLHYNLKERYQQRSFTASIISLAVKGFLRIEESEGSGIFFKSKIFDLVRLKSADDSLPKEERQIMDNLLSSREKVSIDGNYHAYVETTYQAHQGSLSKQFRKFITQGNNTKFIALPFFGSFFIAVLAFFLFTKSPYAAGINMVGLISFGVLALIGLALYYYLIKKPTVEKLDLQSRIKGYKMYLELAEKDRLNLLNPPELTPQHFEEALPFAFALGVEHQWSKRFEKILEAAQYRPDWTTSANPIFFADNFGKSFANNLTGSATKPSQSGGGSGGGGFSGGGGGGGGVGGW